MQTKYQRFVRTFTKWYAAAALLAVAMQSAQSVQACDPNSALCSPLDPNISDIPSFFKELLNMLLILAIPFIVFFIILAGFKYVTARGDTNKIQESHQALLYAVVGGLIVVGAFAILTILSNMICSFASNCPATVFPSQ